MGGEILAYREAMNAIKVGRNDSCPCGSGRKYKKCCLLKDDEANRSHAVLQARTEPALETSNRRDRPEQPADPRMDALNVRYEEFMAADYENRIALFERTLNEPLLMDGEMAFTMLNELFYEAVERDERDRYDAWVEHLRDTVPDVYEEEAAFLLENRITNAIAMRRHERIHAHTLELAALAEKKFDAWHRAESQLAYHGDLHTLIAAMRLVWLNVRNSDDILPWARLALANRATQYVILNSIEHTPALAGDDPALVERIRCFWVADIDRERTAEIVAWQAGRLERRWIEGDFKRQPRKRRSRRTWDEVEDDDGDGPEPGGEPDTSAQNLLNLTLQFVGYAHRVEGKPYSRAELARAEIYTFIGERQAGKLEYRESMLDTAFRASGRMPSPVKKFKPYGHLLCPDYERLDRYMAGLLDRFNVRLYPAVALLESVPTWMRFLQSQGLIDADACRRTLHEIRPLAASVLRILKEMRSDPALYEAIQQCAEFAPPNG